MIKSIYIDNFKILNDFRLDFELVTVLIGENSVGKSTVLQALELLSYFTQVKKYGTLDNYLSSNGWAVKDIKSTLSRKQLVQKSGNHHTTLSTTSFSLRALTMLGQSALADFSF
jgi:AAA15 family ATPase/GTPase